MDWQLGKLIYDNPLASETNVKGWRMEGEAKVSFPNGRMRMENARDASEGQAANFVYWCPKDFSSDVAISWDFYPIREPGLGILFFAAKGKNGEDVFDPNLARRTGDYQQYHHGDINALHVSYFRRKAPEERAFHTCNLRKSFGFHLVAQGGDPLPDVDDARPPYRIKLVKCGPEVAFYINDLPVFDWTDDGSTYGPLVAGGKIGFRQMAPLIAEYANLQVHEVRKKGKMSSSMPPTQVSPGWRPAVHAYFDLCPESPDGKRLVYFEISEGPPFIGQVMVATLGADGLPIRHQPISGPIRGGTHSGVEQQWVDNDTVAYVDSSQGGRGTCVYSLKDGSERRIEQAIRMFCPANGLALGSSGGRGDTKPTVFQMDIATGDVKKLFTREDCLAIHPMRDSIKDPDHIYFKHTKWTDDGRLFMVVFTNEGYDRPKGYPLAKSIFVAGADGSGLRYVTEFGHHPMWSPDGKFPYAFEFAEAGLLNLMAYPLDGRPAYPIIAKMRGWHASLGPDGKTVVTDVGSWEQANKAAILLYDVATASPKVLATMKMPDVTHETGIHAHPVWSRDGKRVYYNSAESGSPQVWVVGIGA